MSARPLRGLMAGVMAAWVALTLLRRLWRGEVVVLSPHGAPVVRLLAIVLVFLGGCVERLRPAPPRSGELSQEPGETPLAQEPVVAVEQAFPAELDDADLQRVYNWIEPRTLHQHFEAEEPGAAPRPLPRVAAELDVAARRRAEVFAAAIGAHLQGAVTAMELLALLDAAEAADVYDEWLAGHVWRHARAIVPAPVELFARLERHLRVVHALVLAQASTGPLEFSAWRSKAGPPPGWQRLQVPPGLVAAARAAFEQDVEAGPWVAAASLELKVARGEVVLVRRGGAARLAAGASLRLGRLDLVRASSGAALHHAALGELSLPAGAALTAWNAGQFLGEAGQGWVQARLRAAQAGDSLALTELEAALPAVHAAIRAALVDARGRDTAALRLVLQAFDE